MSGARASRAAAQPSAARGTTALPGSREDTPPRARRRDARGYDEIIARSSLHAEALHAAQLLGERPLVFITGEIGTAKALVARMIHGTAGLEGRFVRVRCSAEPGFSRELFGDPASGAPGRVDEARGGTLFLEAIDELSPELQARVLRLVYGQSRGPAGEGRTPAANVRVVAASERALWPLVEDGRLREDLYRRLKAHAIELAPLRDHPDEIAPLAQRLLYLAVRRSGGRARQLAPSTLDTLARYAWPGNVRELKRVIEALVADSGARVLELPRGWLAPPAAPEQSDELAEHDRQRITEALRQSNGALLGPNGAASRLGMTASTLRFRMRRLGLSRPGADRR
jgi:formate hydrogenlyase transcriptional activator